jgi:hypothetical protein
MGAFSGGFHVVGEVHVSTNAGASWQATGAPHDKGWVGVACSADASILAAATILWDYIYISTNSGADWTTLSIPNWSQQSVAMSGDGHKLIVSQYWEAIYTSTNFGVTCETENIPLWQWTGAVSSADGNKLVAVADSGQIYTWQASPNPALEIAKSDVDVVVSWMVPSARFVLQEKSSRTLSQWQDVQTSRTLNYSSLRYETRIPAENDSAYYRLVSR